MEILKDPGVTEMLMSEDDYEMHLVGASDGGLIYVEVRGKVRPGSFT